jgi:hypothetical protein
MELSAEQQEAAVRNLPATFRQMEMSLMTENLPSGLSAVVDPLVDARADELDNILCQAEKESKALRESMEASDAARLELLHGLMSKSEAADKKSAAAASRRAVPKRDGARQMLSEDTDGTEGPMAAGSALQAIKSRSK